MSSDYFEEFKTGVNNAWKVEQSSWKLYGGLSSGLVLDSSIPTQPFKIAITLSAVSGHSICAGSVAVGEETLDFSGATRKTTSQDLAALPDISVSGLDCWIIVECITSARAPIYREGLTPIEIICFPKTHILRDPSGSGWMQTNYDIWTEAALSIGDQIRYSDPHQGGTIDIYVKNVSSGVDLEDNSQPFRVLNCS